MSLRLLIMELIKQLRKLMKADQRQGSYGSVQVIANQADVEQVCINCCLS